MPDTCDQAQQLADLFTALAAKVDAFRNAHYDELSDRQRSDLEEEIEQLYDCHDQFAGDAIQNTLATIQADVPQIVSVTQQANAALEHLNDIEKVASIASAATGIVADILTADYGAIPEAVYKFAQAVNPPPDKK